MPSVRINKELNKGIYFLTFTVNRWYYLFDRHNRWDILLKSLKYCREKKGIKIYHWVFMLNHIHIIVKSDDVIGFVRDFKTFTSKELKKNIVATEPNILKLFEEDGVYQFWQKTNMPILVANRNFYVQKAKYIEYNPVRKGYVRSAEYWVYSSANKEDCLLELDTIDG
ncbi:MAG TPA: transposase [Candidatus Brocadiaceae bacterium]|nr:transposase [Candidatus Brocadiaceae bacterium]